MLSFTRCEFLTSSAPAAESISLRTIHRTRVPKTAGFSMSAMIWPVCVASCGAKILPVGMHDRSRYVLEVRSVWIEYVVSPVRLENAEVGRVVAPVRGDWV